MEAQEGRVWVVGRYQGGSGETISWSPVGFYSSAEKAYEHAGKYRLFVTGPFPLDYGMPPRAVVFPKGFGWCPLPD